MREVYVAQYSMAHEFLDRARDWLTAAEVENQLILSLCANLVARREPLEREPFFATVEAGGAILGAALMTPPNKLLISPLSGAAVGEALAHDLHGRYLSVPAVMGSPDAVVGFANSWARLVGCTVYPGMPQGLYELREVLHPRYTPGALRQALWDDLALLLEWRSRFIAEVGAQPETPEQSRQMTERLLAEGAIYFWDTQGPVSMAGAANASPRGMRVGWVYTPPALRNRGYATSCVAALSQQLLDAGWEFCCLFTDLRNPTATDIYQRIGYQWVCRWDEAGFEENWRRPGGG
jgi:GNAT superfamily N-acetyltransferase